MISTTAVITNGMPQMLNRATQDLSTTEPIYTPVALPQHLPRFWTFAKKGPFGEQLLDSATASFLYGADTFDPVKKYCTHQTPFINAAFAAGNNCVIERIIADDANPPANILISLDVLPITIPRWQRNATRGFVTDSSGNRVPLTDANGVALTASGYQVKWVATAITNGQATGPDSLSAQFGNRQITQGDQTYTHNGNPVYSQRYPIFDIKADVGDDANNTGFGFFSPVTGTGVGVDPEYISVTKAYPYVFNIFRRADTQSSGSAVTNNYGSKNAISVFKPNALDPLTSSKRVNISDNFLVSYTNDGSDGSPVVTPDIKELAVYQANIDLLTNLFYASEAPFVDGNYDFDGTDADKYLFNFVGGHDTTGVFYETFRFADQYDGAIASPTNAAGGFRPSEYVINYANGGSDGTISNAVLDTKVTASMARYGDPTSDVMNMALYPATWFYDSGFGLPAKQALANAMAYRRDTIVVFGCFIAGQADLTNDEEISVGQTLKARASSFPESAYFATPAARAVIMAQSGQIIGSTYIKRVPITYELLVKSAAQMGAASGSWVTNKDFDSGDGAIVTSLYNLSAPVKNWDVRNAEWQIGMIYTEPRDTRTHAFPALKTVYGNDTSVLNAYMNVAALPALVRAEQATWQQYTGNSKLEDAQFKKEVEDYFTNLIKGRFDGRFRITPTCNITASDLQRGYSWELIIKFEANIAKTVQTSVIQAYRMAATN